MAGFIKTINFFDLETALLSTDFTVVEDCRRIATVLVDWVKKKGKLVTSLSERIEDVWGGTWHVLNDAETLRVLNALQAGLTFRLSNVAKDTQQGKGPGKSDSDKFNETFLNDTQMQDNRKALIENRGLFLSHLSHEGVYNRSKIERTWMLKWEETGGKKPAASGSG